MRPILSRRSLARVGAVLLAIPVSIHVLDGVTIALGHATARRVGPYFPIVAYLGVTFIALSHWGPLRKSSTAVVKVSLLLVATMAFSAVIGPLMDQRSSLHGALFFIQAALPLLVFAWFATRTSDLYGMVVHTFSVAACFMATLLVVSRIFLSFSPKIGYPDVIGGIGIPSSLRFFPTVVSLGLLGLVAEVIIERRARVCTSLLILGSVLLLGVAHSRTALVAAAAGCIALTYLALRRDKAFVLPLVLGLVGVVALAPILSQAPSVTRLVEGAGASDANRLEATIESFASSFESPIGAGFVPTVAARTEFETELRRVVTAENQFGAYGASAGPLALFVSLLLAALLTRQAWSGIRSSDPAPVMGGAVLLGILATLPFQITLSQAHTSMVFAVIGGLLVSLQSTHQEGIESAYVR